MAFRSKFRFLVLAGAAVWTAGVFTPAHAQDPDDLKRGVARISLMNGDVSVRRGDSSDWVAAVINAPLMTDDRIAAAANSRGEVQFDASNMLRFGANTELRFTQLENSRFQMELGRGIVTYRVLRASDANVEIDTPNVSVRPSKQGEYRISVNDAGETEVTVRAGDVEVFTPTGSQWIRSGQTMLARGTAADPEFQIVAANSPDEWDRWSEGRDRMLLRSVSPRYVGAGVYGAEDLDNYGSWTNVPEYGNVWRPQVAADWAPYHDGRWVWEDWYGWTWVSYDPWGWAPYHYGRWFHDGGLGWCWYPGVIGARHYWSPALVGFFGFGHGVGVGFGFGNIGWVPLAPYEIYRPWWGRGFYGREGFNRSVNITNVNITNVYRNSRYNGVSGMGVNDFQSGRFHNNVQRFNGSQIQNAGLVRGQLPITPNAAHQNFSDRRAVAMPRSNQPSQFFTHQQPNPVGRQSSNGGQQFGSNRQPLSGGQSGGQPGGQAVNGGGSVAARSQGFPGQTTPSQNNANGSWRRFGSPSGPGSVSQSGAPQNNGYRGGQPNNNQMMRNDRPAQAQPGNQPAQSQPGNQPSPRSNPSNGGGWQRFGAPARNNYQNSSPRSSAPSGDNGQALRISPPVVRDRQYNAPQQSAPSYYNAPRQSAPSYSAPRQSAPNYYNAPRQSAPSYSAPRQSVPSYSAPRQSAPSYSAPRQSAPSYSAPRSNSGGGGGGNHGGGGGGGNQGGGGGGHRR